MPRRLAVLVLLCSALLAHAEIRVGPPVRIGAGSRVPATTNPSRLQAVATNWGYVAVWRTPNGVRAVRISREGVLLDDPAIVIASRPSVATLATDGTDVLIAYVSAQPSGATTFEIVRVTRDGEVVPFHTLTKQPAAIVWTGTSYVVFAGACDVAEALQLDRTGGIIRSVRTSLPFFACNDARPLLFRDSGGVVRAIVQRPVLGSTDEFDVGRLALTNAQGDPIETASVEWLSTPGHQVVAAGPTANGFFLLSRKSIRFFDNAGQEIRGPRPLDTNTPHAAGIGGEAIVADVHPFPGMNELQAWRLAPNGRRMPMAVGAVSTRLKRDLTVLPSSNGAAVFWLESSPSMQTSSVMMTLIGRGPAGRLREPVALERTAADQRHHHAAAHGDGMMAVWSQYGVLGDEVVAAVLDSSANQTGELHRIMPGFVPRIASNGEVALVVALSLRGGYAMRVDRDGVPLDKTPIALPLAPRDVVWDGSAFLVQMGLRQAMRIDEFGRLLTPEPVELTASYVFNASTIAVSPAGPLFLFMGRRGADDSATALFAQNLTRDLKPLGEPVLVSILGTEYDVAAVWRGDHYLVATGREGLRTTRISAAGEPLGDVFGELVADDGGTSFAIGIVDGRVVVATRMAIAAIDGQREVMATTSDILESRAILTTRDGRSWLFHVDLNTLPVPAFARELSVSH